MLVHEIPIVFLWHPGFAASQKKRSVEEFHQAAAARGLEPLLEISSKSEARVGQHLSAFHLKMDVDGEETTVECAYQGSKVFEKGGPYTDLYSATSREAKRDPRIRESGKIVSFRFEGEDYPLTPATAFYDWLYFKALFPHREWLRERADVGGWAGFTDIEFNPERSINCQARSFAAFLSLQRRGLVEEAHSSFETFKTYLASVSV
jgi:hypothetical protein